MARKPALQPVERAAPLAERVYEMLREHLHSGRVRPGEPLRELVLAAELGVSRTPVREALARLASEGLVEVNGRSYCAPSLTGGDVEDIYELRLLLEPEAARKAAQRPGGEAELAAIREALAEAERAHARGSAAGFIAANRRFRAAWLALVPNRRLVRAVEIYAAHVRALQSLTLGDRERQKRVLAGMREILRALERREPQAAADAMRRYLAIARAAMQQVAGGLSERKVA